MSRTRLLNAALTFVFALLLSSPAAARSQFQPLAQSNAPVAEEFASLLLTFPFVPDAGVTTGSLCHPDDDDFERFRYDEQIPYCKRNVHSRTKKQIYEAYGVPEHCRKEYTIDHFIPLSIGGTNHPNNLWPEHHSIKSLRADLEWEVYKDLEKGRITQVEAIRRIQEAKWHPPVGDPGDFSFCD